MPAEYVSFLVRENGGLLQILIGYIRRAKWSRPAQHKINSKLWRSCISVPVLLPLCMPANAENNRYLLGPQDKVRVRAYEWRASRDEIFEWKALNEEFMVGASGNVLLPFVGEVHAAGVSVAELANVIADRLQAGMGMSRRPDTAVEVVQFRPFYVTGHVDRPGEFPYRPGLTVLQAVSIGGGLRRLGEEGSTRLGRESIAARGDLSVFSMQGNNLLARKARLEAELKNADTIAFPAVLAGRRNDASIALVMQQEQLIFNARREAFRTQLQALEQLKGYLEGEITSLNALVEKEEIQIRLVKKELVGVSSLVEKGYTAAPRQLGLERSLAQVESDRIRLGTALLKARQEISKTDIAILELQNKRANEVTIDLRETQTKLEEANRKFQTTEQLLYETEVVAPQMVAQRARARKAQPIYTILRRSGADTAEFEATETTPIEPGDTVKVEVPYLIDRGPFADVVADRAGNDMAIGSEGASQLQTR